MELIDYMIYGGMALLVMILISGLVTMWRGGKYSNRLMWMRIAVQFAVIVLLAYAVFILRK